MSSALVNQQQEFGTRLKAQYGEACVFLIAEDNPADEALVCEMLYQAFGDHCRVECVDCYQKTLERLDQSDFSALILDMGLPDQSGVSNIDELGAKYPDLPIVVLTGLDDIQLAVTSVQRGAQDYLSKNRVSPELLARSLFYAKERKSIELQLRLALEESDKKNEQLEALAKHDALTGLPNRLYLHDVGKHALSRAERKQMELALLFFDLNGFKKINDTYGHLAGDSLLKIVAERMQQQVRASDLLVRLGGDEFVVMTDVLQKRDGIYPLVGRMLQAFDAVFEIEGHQLVVKPSIGVAFYPDAGSLDLLMKNADSAMYEAKNSSLEEKVCFFTAEMAEQYARRNQIEHGLAGAFERGEFEVCFHPAVHTSRHIYWIEALARWNSPSLGLILPEEFIEVAERNSIANEITRFVLKAAAELYKSLEGVDALQGISVNVCVSQIEQPDFCDWFLGCLSEFNISPAHVCLEVTEKQMNLRSDSCASQMQCLREKGVMIALDDYGAGFSSLTHLVNLEIDVLKLDPSLIRGLDRDPRRKALAAGLVEMARYMGIRTLAEGVETQEELKEIAALGFDAYQGYLIAQPMALKEAVLYRPAYR